MFREHKTSTPATLFTGFGQILGEQKLKRLEDKRSWDNIFREQVTFAIDERIFSVLYSQENGRPSAPIRILVGMLILKEGFGWSDSELYDESRFNIRVMNALGLSNASDEVPVESTYYEFQKKLYEYQIKEGRSLIAEASEKTTKTQAEIFSVNAKWIRMDSKLVGSNIVKSTRLQLIISCLQEFYKSLDEDLKRRLRKGDREILEELVKKKAYQIVYQSSKEQKEEYLKRFGELLSRLEEIYSRRDGFPKDRNSNGSRIEEDKYLMIKRLYKEQYQKNPDGKIELKSESQIPSDAIQSPYDTDAAYRKKGDKKVRGYSINIVETCNKGELNLVLGAEVYKANKSDNEMLEEGTKQAERISGKVKRISVDGAYHSPENQKYAKSEGKVIHLSGITGGAGDYDFEQVDGKLKVKNKETGEEMIAHITKKGHYRIKESNGKRRYFTKEQIESYRKRKEVEQLPKEIRNVRCNVEASIFQSCFHLKKDKTKYRGHFRHQLWAKCRMMWINIVRIRNHIVRLYQKKQKAIPAFT
ncbi:MAG: transposase [Nanoarchaeota archaeon]|nr:transposase [Nanoarchaeota archaeon]